MAQVIVGGQIVEIDCCLLDHAAGHEHHGRSVAERLAHCADIARHYSYHRDPVAQQAIALRMAAHGECLLHAEAVLFGGACEGACCEAGLAVAA